MNLKAPLNPETLAETWPKVEQSIQRDEEAQAIAAYLAAIDKFKALRPDRPRTGRRWK